MLPLLARVNLEAMAMKEIILHIPENSSITGASPSYCLVSYPGHSLRRALSLCRGAVGVFYRPSQLGQNCIWCWGFWKSTKFKVFFNYLYCYVNSGPENKYMFGSYLWIKYIFFKKHSYSIGPRVKKTSKETTTQNYKYERSTNIIMSQGVSSWCNG